MPSRRCMAKISGEGRSVLKRVGRTQRLVPAGESGVALPQEVVPTRQATHRRRRIAGLAGADEVSLAAVVADVAANSRKLVLGDGSAGSPSPVSAVRCPPREDGQAH